MLGDGRGPDGQVMHDGARSPDVRVYGVEGQLRGLVGRGADVVFPGAVGEVGGREAEVAEDDGRVFSGAAAAAAARSGGEFEEDVVGFDVAVEDGAPVWWFRAIGVGTVDAGVEEGEGGGEGGEGVPEETFGDEGLVEDVVFFEGDEVAAIAVFHPAFDLREGIVEVVEFGQVGVHVAEDVADDVDFGGDVVDVIDHAAGRFQGQQLTGCLVLAKFDFAEPAFADISDPAEIFLEAGFFDLVLTVGLDTAAEGCLGDLSER